jgi:3-oxoacyl-[acyl-carrier-protein] synthase II
MRRVAVTGMGAVTPLGVGVPAFWEGLTAGRSGVGRITRFDPSRHRSQIAAEVKGFDPLGYMEKKEVLRTDLFIQYAMAAAGEALADAGLKLPDGIGERAGVIVGTGMGGIPRLLESYEIVQQHGPERAVPYMLPGLIPNMAAGWISMRFGARGPNSSVSTACAAGSHAIGDAFRLIQRGEADVMLAGGSEAILLPLVFCGFDSLRALSPRNDAPERASRPFDAGRDGFVMGEGAGILVLEELERARARGACIHAELRGYGMTADAHHPTLPAPEGDGPARAMALALADAGLRHEEVGYINAHGTSTPFNDANETLAIKRVFGAHAGRLAVSSIKSMIGHLLGAAGALAAISTALALREGILPPTINYETPDPQCDLDYVPNAARRAPARVALVNAFAFGGTNAVLAFQAPREG